MPRRKEVPFVRHSLAELPTIFPELKIKRIAKNLDDDKALIMANLYECLMDVEHKLPKRKYKIFEMAEDLGVRKLQVGTPGGGYYGPYRLFHIKMNGVDQIVGIGVNRYVSKKRTVLCVSLQKGDNVKPHHSLQLAVDEYLRIDSKNTCRFMHRGNIGLGAIGSGKSSILREKYVEPLYPQIISGKEYLLGELKTDRLWYLNNRLVVKFVENLISYALVRDMYRDDANLAAGITERFKKND
ncbi:MAG: hypothetical protein IJ728_09850 [Selenomonadaceae bacterium]|nr:hypothetical protein [Selenomonadaceae bacterium]